MLMNGMDMYVDVFLFRSERWIYFNIIPQTSSFTLSAFEYLLSTAIDSSLSSIYLKQTIQIHSTMPILELKSLDKLPKKKPFKFLSGVFRRGGSVERELEVTEDMLYGTEVGPSIT